jgi:hypothetical protein
MDGKRLNHPEHRADAVEVSCPPGPPALDVHAARVLLRIVVRLADSKYTPSANSRRGRLDRREHQCVGDA